MCGTCQFAHLELATHDDVSTECRKPPPTIINSGSLAKFLKILPKWHCNEYLEGGKKYWNLYPDYNMGQNSIDTKFIYNYKTILVLNYKIKFYNSQKFL